MRAAFALSGVALSCLIGSTALAGTVITMETNAGGGEKPATNTMLLESDRLKMTTDKGGMIYRADQSKIWMLDDADKTYREMTPETMQQMRGQMNEAMQRMQQQMQSMPPEQRKQMEQMMAQRGMGPPMAGAAPRQVTYEKAGASKTVEKWPCTPYKMSINGEAQNELCVAKLSDVGLSRDDLKAFSSLGSFMSQMMAAPGAERNMPPSAFDFEGMAKSIGYDGIPVQTIRLSDDGKPEVESTLTSIDHKNIPADTFEVPAGFTKQEMPMGRPPRVVQ